MTREDHKETNSWFGNFWTSEWPTIRQNNKGDIIIESFEYGLDDPILTKNYSDGWKQLVEDYMGFFYASGK
ncbi:MAG: hypothetical protein LBE13_16030 [Bacteroidales bacterium]|jgi:hypothetical protein|nr:hypothetical protein [Bacteroidales bacterium]